MYHHLLMEGSKLVTMFGIVIDKDFVNLKVCEIANIM